MIQTKKTFLIFSVACLIVAGALCVLSGTFSCTAEDTTPEGEKQVAPQAAPPAGPAEAVPDEKCPDTKDAAVPQESPGYDLSDLSNWNLTVSAWEKLAEKDYTGVRVFIDKCLELYEAEAKEIALNMRGFARLGREDDFAVVNDVATCHYILGETNMRLGHYEDAVKEFDQVIKAYPYAQCWDPKGWFWKIAEVSGKNIQKIKNLQDAAESDEKDI